jgi:uncharacterized membrane protein
MQLKTSHLITFVFAGIGLMTFLVFKSQVRKEVLDVIQEQYERGNISEEKYKSVLADGKVTNWEALSLKN